MVSVLEDQQTQTSEQIPPSTGMQQDDDLEVAKIAINISTVISGSMIAIILAHKQKKPDNISLRINDLLPWVSLVLSVILVVLAVVLTLFCPKNKQLKMTVRVTAVAITVLLILVVVDLFIAHMMSGNK